MLEENHDTLIFVYDSPVYDFDSEYSIRQQDKEEYLKYFNGYLDVQFEFDENNDKYCAYIAPFLLDKSSDNFFKSEFGYFKYGMMITVKPKDTDKSFYIDAWSSTCTMFATNRYLPSGITKYGVTAPSRACTGSSECASDRVISVGAYNTKDYYVFNGTKNSYPEYYPLGDISDFSSYVLKDAGPLSGTDKARAMPDITAPGATILGAVPSAYMQSASSYICVMNEDYPFMYSVGTSFSCPAAAGVIALWLQAAQANGLSLGVDDIRSIIEKTADKDEFTTDTDGNPVPAFGPNGKINAVKGIVEILKMAAEKGSTTGLVADNTAKPVKEVFYVNLSGSMSRSPFPGEVNLKVTRYTDGTESVVKIIL